MEPVILRTPRLVLSVPVPDDVDAITAAVQDPEIPRWTTLPSPYTRADGEEFVARSARRWAAGEAYDWAVRGGGRLVGMIGLYRPDAGAAEIGYWIAADARGDGIAAEACGAVIDWGFAALDLARIEWRASVGNLASARVARRLGFRYEGLLRQALVSPQGRTDGWIAGLLPDDDRTPVPWPVLNPA